VREYHRKKPLILLSGHGHILFYQDLDNNSFTIESGCFFQNLGVIRFRLEGPFEDLSDAIEPHYQIVDLSHEWIDTNINVFYNMTNLTSETFPTSAGLQVRQLTDELFNSLGLNQTIGCMPPQPPMYNPALPFLDPTSLYNIYLTSVLPSIIFNNSRNVTAVGLSNTGMLRYPLFAGEVILDDIYTIDPFHENYYAVFDIQGTNLFQLLMAMNHTRPDLFVRQSPYHPKGGSYIFDVKTLPLQNPFYPPYYWYPTTFQDDAFYDLVFTEYDGVNVNETYVKIFDKLPIYGPYPSTFTETSVWIQYISQFFPCPPS